MCIKHFCGSFSIHLQVNYPSGYPTEIHTLTFWYMDTWEYGSHCEPQLLVFRVARSTYAFPPLPSSFGTSKICECKTHHNTITMCISHEAEGCLYGLVSSSLLSPLSCHHHNHPTTSNCRDYLRAALTSKMTPMLGMLNIPQLEAQATKDFSCITGTIKSPTHLTASVFTSYCYYHSQ